MTSTKIVYTIEPMTEYSSYRYRKGEQKKIRKEIMKGNRWAWCCVRVRAEAGGLTGEDYFGRCSYASEADFKAEGGYWEDMKQTAKDSLLRKLRMAHDAFVDLQTQATDVMRKQVMGRLTKSVREVEKTTMDPSPLQNPNAIL